MTVTTSALRVLLWNQILIIRALAFLATDKPIGGKVWADRLEHQADNTQKFLDDE